MPLPSASARGDLRGTLVHFVFPPFGRRALVPRVMVAAGSRAIPPEDDQGEVVRGLDPRRKALDVAADRLAHLLRAGLGRRPASSASSRARP